MGVLRFLVRFLLVEALWLAFWTGLWLAIWHQWPRVGMFILFFSGIATPAYKWAIKPRARSV